MNFPNTFALRVINERQEQGYNRQTLYTVLATVNKHPKIIFLAVGIAREVAVGALDCLGRVDVVFLSAVLAQSA